MPTYTARFRTETEFANKEFEADTPDHALKMAQAWLEENDFHDLDFEDYDKAMPVEEIEIMTEDEDGLAVWQSDDLRLHLAAGDLLEALQMVVNEYGYYLLEERMQPADAATIRAAIKKAAPAEQTS